MVQAERLILLPLAKRIVSVLYDGLKDQQEIGKLCKK